jgi:hypothetical protein
MGWPLPITLTSKSAHRVMLVRAPIKNSRYDDLHLRYFMTLIAIL